MWLRATFVEYTFNLFRQLGEGVSAIPASPCRTLYWNGMSLENSNEDIVQSPCVGVCAVSEATGLCEGCYRTLDEIRDWWNMESTEQRQVIEKLQQRQLELANFD